MASAKETARTVKKTETRQKLLEAARRLFSCSAYEGVKVEDITKEAGLAKGTFFNYFASKEDAISEVQFMTTYDCLMPLLVVEGPIVPLIKQALVQSLVEHSESKSLMRAVLLTKLKDDKQLKKQSEQFQAFYNGLTQLVDKAKQEGEVRTDIPSLQVVQMVEQMYMGILMQWCLVVEDNPIDDVIIRSFDVLFAGLQPTTS